MRIKPRNSLWIVVALALGFLLQSVIIFVQLGDLQDVTQQLSDKELELWSQKTSSDRDLAYCQEAVEIALENINGNNVTYSKYVVDVSATRCLGR
ncbi:Hypothetical protein MONT_48 [Glutamicibacter phage Montesquieu]|nr:Hypothetical protein MONT_48 [Glutamicibacter phage Montesquieu]